MKKIISKLLAFFTFVLLSFQNVFAVDFKVEIRTGIIGGRNGKCNIVTELKNPKAKPWFYINASLEQKILNLNGKCINVKDKNIIKILRNPFFDPKTSETVLEYFDSRVF